jgi:L-amino acid N-acyltransferase YncA
MIIIRKATSDDLAAITEIYNQAILRTTATFDTEPKSLEEQKVWFESHGPKYPVLVAEEDGKVTGWASLSKWSGRCAYSDTAEISLYIDEKEREKGIGRKLLKAIIRQGEKTGIHSIIARIAEGNEASIHLHKSVGFEHIGIMKEVGRKFGRLLDIYFMQKIYKSPHDFVGGK